DRVGLAAVPVREEDDDGRDEREGDEEVNESQRSRHRGDGRSRSHLPQGAVAAVSTRGSRLGGVTDIVVRPRGPYSLALSARLAGDATRRVHEGLVTARCSGAVARAWQSPDGTVTIRSES